MSEKLKLKVIKLNEIKKEKELEIDKKNEEKSKLEQCNNGIDGKIRQLNSLKKRLDECSKTIKSKKRKSVITLTIITLVGIVGAALMFLPLPAPAIFISTAMDEFIKVMCILLLLAIVSICGCAVVEDYKNAKIFLKENKLNDIEVNLYKKTKEKQKNQKNIEEKDKQIEDLKKEIESIIGEIELVLLELSKDETVKNRIIKDFVRNPISNLDFINSDKGIQKVKNLDSNK